MANPERIAMESCGKAGDNISTRKALAPSVMDPAGPAPTMLRFEFVPLQTPFWPRLSAPLNRIPQAVAVKVAVTVEVGVFVGVWE